MFSVPVAISQYSNKKICSQPYCKNLSMDCSVANLFKEMAIILPFKNDFPRLGFFHSMKEANWKWILIMQSKSISDLLLFFWKYSDQSKDWEANKHH